MSQGATTVFYILLAVGLLPLMALFAIAGVTILNTQGKRIEKLMVDRTAKSESVLETIQKVQSELATSNLGLFLALAGSGWVISRLWSIIITPWTSVVSQGWLMVTGLLALTVTTSIYVVLGFIVPAGLASRGLPPLLCKLATGLISVTRIPLYPLVVLIESISRLILKLGKRYTEDDLSTIYAPDQLPYTALKSYRYGLLGAAQRELLTRLFDFKERTARDIATPAHEMACLVGQTRLSEALEIVKHLGFTRYPVVDGTKERVIGVVHYRDLMDGHDANPRQFVTDVMEPAVFVSTDMPITNVLKELQKHRAQMAIVSGNHEGIEGLLTIEDVLHEFFDPDIDQEAHQPPLFRPISQDTYEFDGRLIIHEVEDILGIRLSHAGLETIGNYVFSLLGRKAREGDHVKISGVSFDVIQMKGARITRLRARKTREIPPELDYPAPRSHSS